MVDDPHFSSSKFEDVLRCINTEDELNLCDMQVYHQVTIDNCDGVFSLS